MSTLFLIIILNCVQQFTAETIIRYIFYDDTEGGSKNV